MDVDFTLAFESDNLWSKPKDTEVAELCLDLRLGVGEMICQWS